MCTSIVGHKQQKAAGRGVSHSCTFFLYKSTIKFQQNHKCYFLQPELPLRPKAAGCSSTTSTGGVVLPCKAQRQLFLLSLSKAKQITDVACGDSACACMQRDSKGYSRCTDGEGLRMK